MAVEGVSFTTGPAAMVNSSLATRAQQIEARNQANEDAAARRAEEQRQLEEWRLDEASARLAERQQLQQAQVEPSVGTRINVSA